MFLYVILVVFSSFVGRGRLLQILRNSSKQRRTKGKKFKSHFEGITMRRVSSTQRQSRRTKAAFFESDAERMLAKLDRLDKRILIEIYREPINDRIIAERVSASQKEVRHRLRSQKRLMAQLTKEVNGTWYLTPLGQQVCEILKQNPLFKGFFY